MSAEPKSFTVTLEPIPGWPTNGTQRLRLALKQLLRGYGLRCTSIATGQTDDGHQSDNTVPRVTSSDCDPKRISEVQP